MNFLSEQFTFQNTEVKKKNPNKYGYDVYEEQFNEFGEQIDRNVLGKYDEEIDGVKASTFSIGENLADVMTQKRRLLEVSSCDVLLGFVHSSNIIYFRSDPN